MTGPSKVASLRPWRAEPQPLLIDKLLGPGLTVIGSDKPIHRYNLQEQMATDVARGEKFLGLLDTYKCRVLIATHGPKDYRALKERYQGSEFLDIRERWPRIGDGCLRELRSYKETCPDFELAFLGDFQDLRSTFNKWCRKKYSAACNTEEPSVKIDFQPVVGEMEVENVKRLARFSDEYGIGIVIGDDLNTKGNPYYWRSLRHCHDMIRIRTVKGEWRLEVLSGGYHVRPMTWGLTCNDTNFFQFDATFKKEAIKVKAKARGELPLTEREIAILDAMWDKGPVTPREIINETKIADATVYQRLKALQSKKKGEWVLGLQENPLFCMVNTDKERYW
jgi:hypothetical protein